MTEIPEISPKIEEQKLFPGSSQQEDEDLLYMENYLNSIITRINPPFFERKMQRGVAETIEEEIEELYSEMYELDAYVRSLVNTNAHLLNNYEEKTREITEKKQRLSNRYQSLREQIQQQKKDINEMESLKTKLATRNEALSEQIKKMEQMYNKTSKQYDNLNEEILTMSDYQDKLYQLKEEWSLNQDLINNLKYEHNEYQMMMDIIKQKTEKKDRTKSILKNKLGTIEEKLKNLNDKEKSEINMIEHMTHHLEFLRKTYQNLKEVNLRKEEEKRMLNMVIDHQQASKRHPKHSPLRPFLRPEPNESGGENSEKAEKKPEVKEEKKKYELDFDNLENEFREMNIEADVFSNGTDHQFGLFSNRNTRLTPSGNTQVVVPKLDEGGKPIEGKKEAMNKSKVGGKKKRRKQNEDQVFIETLNFFVKHKYKIMFLCFAFPFLRWSYS